MPNRFRRVDPSKVKKMNIETHTRMLIFLVKGNGQTPIILICSLVTTKKYKRAFQKKLNRNEANFFHFRRVDPSKVKNARADMRRSSVAARSIFQVFQETFRVIDPGKKLEIPQRRF